MTRRSLLLTTTLLASAPLVAADPALRAERLAAHLDQESGQIIQITADPQGGVWALTRDGRLYYCQQLTNGQSIRLRCHDREGPVQERY